MKISGRKLELELVNACINPRDFCKRAEISYRTFLRITSEGKNCRMSTAGKIAKALDIPAQKILDLEDK